MAEPSAGAQAAVRQQHRVKQLVGVQRALHQQRGLAAFDQRHGFGRRRFAVRNIDEPISRNIDLRRLRRLEDLRFRSD